MLLYSTVRTHSQLIESLLLSCLNHALILRTYVDRRRWKFKTHLTKPIWIWLISVKNESPRGTLSQSVNPPNEPICLSFLLLLLLLLLLFLFLPINKFVFFFFFSKTNTCMRRQEKEIYSQLFGLDCYYTCVCIDLAVMLPMRVTSSRHDRPVNPQFAGWLN